MSQVGDLLKVTVLAGESSILALCRPRDLGQISGKAPHGSGNLRMEGWVTTGRGEERHQRLEEMTELGLWAAEQKGWSRELSEGGYY